MTEQPSGLIHTPFPEHPAEGEACEVAPGVHWIRLPLPMVLDHVNVYALADDDGWTVVDTGLHSRRMRALWEALLQGPLAGRPLRRVLVTHYHPDHVGNAGWLQAEYGAELLTTRTSWLFARMLTLDAQDRPVPETLSYWRRAGMEPAILEARSNERPFNFADVVAPMPLGYTRIKEGDLLQIAGRDWRVRIGNGHAPEHATLWSETDGLVLGGDQLLSTISPNIGVYATEPGADPLADWLASCTNFREFARDDQLVLPGHKLPFTGLPLRLRQLIDNHQGALRRMEAFLDEPRRAPECFPLLFKRTIDENTYGLALVEAIAHLNHLHQAGRVTRSEDASGTWVWQATAAQTAPI